MKKHIILLLLCCGGGWTLTRSTSVQAQTPGGGTISGHVRLAGPAPANPIIRLRVDPMCGKLNEGKRPVHEFVLRSPDGGLANAFVDLEGTFPKAPPSGKPATLDQRNCIYTPRVLGARAGEVLRVTNNDPLMHNVHSQSTQNVFNFSQPKAGMTRDIQLKGPDVVMRITCDVHSWMLAYVGVETHPYYAVSGADGSFQVAGVPPGRRTVRVWHERYGQLTQMVTVAAGKTTTADFSYTGNEKPSKARLQDVPIPLDGPAGVEIRLVAAK
jgi:hypothetical protein